MTSILSASAYANDEVAFIAWRVKEFIPDCVGFEVTRIYPATGEERSVATWVPFQHQSNPQWLPQTSSVWPVQKLTWRDLTVRRRRDATDVRPTGVQVKYRIRPVCKRRPGLEAVNNVPDKTYKGAVVPLSYVDEGMETEPVLITAKNGSISATFTNGILAAQWLTHALEANGEQLTVDAVRHHISTKGDKIREYLTGDVLGTLRSLLDRAEQTDGHVHLALYELSDSELTELLVASKDRIDVILSNSAKGQGSSDWDQGNKLFRQQLVDGGVSVTHRMFNNSHIGHNKFAVLTSKNGAALAVMTGSTNWTPTGMCGQSNNAVIIESSDIANGYLAYWQALQKDTEQEFVTPNPLSAPTTNKQGQTLRTSDRTKPIDAVLPDESRVRVWFSPNTVRTTKGPTPPEDLKEVFELMESARDIILFAVFLPGIGSGDGPETNIVAEAVSLGREKPSLLVYGAVSDPMAMPNYVPPDHSDAADDSNNSSPKTPQPFVYDEGKMHIVRASAVGKDDVVGQFERELLTVGKAIIHDKIVVIDPLSDRAAVVFGSHNQGFKASYENDENLVIVKNNQSLAQAYAVHILDIYDHYRFRAVQGEFRRKRKKSQWDGFLDSDDSWLRPYVDDDKGDLAKYFA